MTWRILRERYLFTALELHTLQPDKLEWVKRGALTLHDMLDMTVFPLNLISDMHADLAELWSMQWTVEELVRMDVTFSQIKMCGLNHHIMMHFGFPLSAWSKLGFDGPAALAMQNDELLLLFGIDQAEVVSILECQYSPVNL